MENFKELVSEKKFILILAIFVAAKYFLFYFKMDVNSYFSIVVMISVFLTGIFFSIFGRMRGLAAFLYLLLSGLMFADVTYYSYFGKYLSVAMLGAAGMVGTITECIDEVMKPSNYLMFADAVIIIIYIIADNAIHKWRISKGYELEEGFKPEATASAYVPPKEAAIVRGCASFAAWCTRVDSALTKAFDRITVANLAEVVETAQSPRLTQEEREESEKRRDGVKQVLVRVLAFALIIVVIIETSPFSEFSLSVRNQEFFNYHIHDILTAHGGTEGDSLEFFEDSYADEKDGPLFGVAEGRNVVFIQLESFMNFAIGREYEGQELTPNLNALLAMDDSVYFDHFYQQVGSGNTSDAEFAANNSIYGTVLSYTYEVYGHTDYFRGLPVLLRESGYDTAVFHAFQEMDYWSRDTAYPNLGFNTYFGGLTHLGGVYELTDWMGWGMPDSDFLDQTASLMHENLKEPYYAFVNTLSNHNPFKMLPKYQFIKLGKDLKDTTVGNYLQSVCYVDYSIGQFFERLKQEGLYDNSVFVLYGDHAGLTHGADIDDKLSALLGTDKYYDSDLLNVPCIIHIPGVNLGYDGPITKATGQLDLLPTVAYLLGWDKLDTIYFGHNMFAPGEGFIAEQTFVKKGSFIKGDIMYEIALDGIFDHGKAWNVDTYEPVPIDGLYEDYQRGMELIKTCEYLLKTDALRTIYLGETADVKSAEYPDHIAVAGYPKEGLVGSGNLAALNTSYDAGERNILLTLKWETDADGNPTGLYTINEDTGAKVLDQYKLVNWFEKHEDVNFVFRLEGERADTLDNVRLFFGNMGGEGTKLGRQIMFYANETDDVTGRYDLFLDVSACGGSVDDLKAFIEANNIWALVLEKDDFGGPLRKLLTLGIKTYVANPDGLIKLL